MNYDVIRTVLGINGATYLPADVPLARPEREDFGAGPRHNGTYQGSNSRRLRRWFELSGVMFDLRGQSASGTQTPEGVLFAAMGLTRSGTTGFTWSRGIPHLAGNTPAGSTTALTSVEYILDTQQWKGEDVVCEGEWIFRAGEIPKLRVDMLGRIPALTAATGSSRSTVSNPTVTAAPLPAAWLGASAKLSSVTGLVFKGISFKLGNRLAKRHDANSANGFAVPGISAHAGTGELLLEMPAESEIQIEELMLAGTSSLLEWGYVAGGASFNTTAYDLNIVITSCEFTDEEGFAGYRVGFEQDAATNLFSFAVS